MKRTVSVVVLVVFVLNCGIRLHQKSASDYEEKERPAPPIEQVSTAIVIDAEKREQLGLFPGIEGFIEARFNDTSSGGYEVEIITQTQRLISVNNDADAFTILQDYIKNYEEIAYDRRSFETRWGILDYDTLGFPITKSQVGRAAGYGHTASCGCAGGLVAAIAAVALFASAKPFEDGYEMGVGIGIMMAGAAAVVTAGLLGGCLGGIRGHQTDKQKAVEKIKEQRRPRMVE